MEAVEILPQVCPAQSAGCVYVLSCADGSLYTGVTSNLTRRLAAHRRGTGAKYTRGRLPIRLLGWWFAPHLNAARSHEARFKRLTRRDKLAALARCEAFGFRVHKPPFTQETDRELPMNQSPPNADEVTSYGQQARASQVRIATDRGDIVVTLFPDDAPMHVAAFLKLVKSGFYDGLAFHRVEPGFVVQGGDPVGDGTGGPGYHLPAEFNARPHLRGTLAMARASSPDSAGSQFYLCLGDARFLDGQYTVFGTMTGGFEALDQIRRGDKMNALTIEPLAASG